MMNTYIIKYKRHDSKRSSVSQITVPDDFSMASLLANLGDFIRVDVNSLVFVEVVLFKQIDEKQSKFLFVG